MSTTDTVFFICLHGSAKSLIAMKYFNQLAEERGCPLRAQSAGTEPDDAVPADVVAGLAADGFDVSGRIPLQVTPELLASAGAVVTFGPDVAAMAPAAASLDQWNDLPAVSDDYAIARDEIHTRVVAFLDRLHAGTSGAEPFQPSSGATAAGLAERLPAAFGEIDIAKH